MRISDWSSDVCSSDLATTPCTRRAFQYHSTVRLQAPRLCPKGLLTVLPWRFSRQSSNDSAPFQRVKNSAYLAGPDFCLVMHNGRNTAQRLVRDRKSTRLNSSH